MANRIKFTNSERAKQFLPYASLRGYYEYILRQETTSVPRRELSDDQCAVISEQLKHLETGVTMSITHYLHSEYVTTIGEVEKIDFNCRCVVLGGQKIWFDDITELHEVTDFAEKNGLRLSRNNS